MGTTDRLIADQAEIRRGQGPPRHPRNATPRPDPRRDVRTSSTTPLRATVEGSPLRLRRADPGGGCQSELLDGDLPHPELLDLAGHGHREAIDQLPVARDLERGDIPTAVVVKLLPGQAHAVTRLDPGHHLLAVPLARQADHLDLR